MATFSGPPFTCSRRWRALPWCTVIRTSISLLFFFGERMDSPDFGPAFSLALFCPPGRPSLVARAVRSAGKESLPFVCFFFFGASPPVCQCNLRFFFCPFWRSPSPLCAGVSFRAGTTLFLFLINPPFSPFVRFLLLIYATSSFPCSTFFSCTYASLFSSPTRGTSFRRTAPRCFLLSPADQRILRGHLKVLSFFRRITSTFPLSPSFFSHRSLFFPPNCVSVRRLQLFFSFYPVARKQPAFGNGVIFFYHLS